MEIECIGDCWRDESGRLEGKLRSVGGGRGLSGACRGLSGGSAGSVLGHWRGAPRGFAGWLTIERMGWAEMT